MRRAALLLISLAVLAAFPATAQEEAVIDVPSADGAAAAPPPAPEEVPPAPEEPKKKEYTDTPQVRLRILDKVRAQSRTYDLEVGHTVAYANIRIRPRACRKSSPLDDPESASFLQIWEILPDGKSSWVFSGWMFASSPSLSAMDHAVYDVTVLECRDPKAENATDEKPADAASEEETKSATDAAIDEYIGEEDVTVETSPKENATPQTNETPSSESAPASAE